MLGGVSNHEKPTAEDLESWNHVKSDVLAQTNSDSNASVEVISVARQVIRGLRYIFKVRIGGDEYEVTVWRDIDQSHKIEDIKKA